MTTRFTSPSRCARYSISTTDGSMQAESTRCPKKPIAKAAEGPRRMATPAVNRTEGAIPTESAEGWRVVLAAYFGVMVSFGSLLVFSFGTFLKPLTAEFGWTREAVSAAFGFGALTVAVVSPLLGRLLDRVPPRAVILPCMAIFGLGFASLGLLTRHLWQLYATFV